MFTSRRKFLSADTRGWSTTLCSSVFISGCFVLVPLNSATAWEGHKWENWKEVAAWTKPVLKTDQAGQAELISLLAVEQSASATASAPSDGSSSTRIDEIRVWESKANHYASAIKSILGDPGELKVPLPDAQVIGEESFEGYTRRHIRVRSDADDWIPAYLLIPKDAAPGRLPAMICVHQTVAQGKEEPVGIKGDPQLAFAEQLVRRGYVCIAPDMIGFGERIPAGKNPYHDSIAFYQRYPTWSFMGKMVWDMSRVVDYLRTLPYVDPLQIGSIGHSHGAYTSMFAAAFDPRISVAIASCGFSTFRGDPSPHRWSHLTALIPQLGTYLPHVEAIPFDWQHIIGLIAPRPLFIWYATQDTIFPKTDNIDAMLQDVRGVYGLYGAAGDLAWQAFDGPHKFPDDGRETAYRWLGERAFATGDIHTVPAKVEDWERQREMIRRVVLRTLGRMPADPPPFDLKTLEVAQQENYERRLIEYSVDNRERVRAYLCLPNVPDRSTARLPGMLVLHQTIAAGKREPMRLEGSPSLAFAADLAERGYVTLAPDSIAAGERIDMGKPFDTRMYYIRHPDLSAMGKMLYDAKRALDLLASVEGVDAQRLGAIGHSLGAEGAMMLAAFDRRVKAAVASCGYATFAADPESDRTRWSRDRWFSYMPRLRPVFLRGDLPAWDWPDVLRLIAPRAFFQHTTMEDEIFKQSRSAYEAGEAAKPVWELYDAADRLTNVYKPGKHDISDEARREMYEWLDRQLENAKH